jgi:endonuclease G
MFLRFFILLATLTSSIAFCCSEIPPELVPTVSIGTIDLCRSDYQIAYSTKLKSPIWVGEHLTKIETNMEEVRVNAFKADPQLQRGQRAELSDYTGTGFDRGHMAPAGDASSKEAMVESFYLSNMIPQVKENNRGIWKSLEEKVRASVLQKNDLFIFTGPIYTGNPKTIGKDNIAIPEALFKIIYDNKTKEVISFIIPNAQEDASKLNTFIVSLHQVNQRTGIEFFKNVKIIELYDSFF